VVGLVGVTLTHLESRIPQSPVKQSRTGPPYTELSAAVFSCRDFQHGVCKSSMITTTLSVVNEIGYNIFALGAGWTHLSSLVTWNFQIFKDSRHLPDITPDSRLLLSPLSQDCHVPEINQDSKLAVAHVNQDDTLPEINQDSRLSFLQLNQDSPQLEIIQDSSLSALNLNQDSSLNFCFHDFSSSVEDQYSLDSSRLSGAAHFSGVSVGVLTFRSFIQLTVICRLKLC